MSPMDSLKLDNDTYVIFLPPFYLYFHIIKNGLIDRQRKL